jgi:hypothetical protein
VGRLVRAALLAAALGSAAAPLATAHAACNPNVPVVCVKPFATCNLTDVTRPICGG